MSIAQSKNSLREPPFEEEKNHHAMSWIRIQEEPIIHLMYPKV